MKFAVSTAFVPVTKPLEGSVAFMYCDILGLVTTAIGVLVDPKSMALSLPFLHPSGRPATRDEIAEDWDRVKARQDLKMRGGMAYKSVAQLRLSEEGIVEVVRGKLALMEGELKRQYAEWETWPADAQLAVLSMAWACGPWFGNQFKSLKKALLARDWTACVTHCHINTNGPDGIAGTLDDNRGVIPRNVMNKALFRNAAIVEARGLDPETLCYPNELDPGPGNAYDPTTITGYQKALALLGYDVGMPDGLAGPKTLAAVKAFQADHGLDVDGRVGPKTQGALLEELRKQKGT